jgi:hypothetical protein
MQTMSISSIGSDPWNTSVLDLTSLLSVSTTSTDQTSNSTGTSAGTSSTGTAAPGSTDPFQQLAAELQALLVQLQSGVSSSSANSTDTSSTSSTDTASTNSSNSASTDSTNALSLIAQDLQALLSQLGVSAPDEAGIGSSSSDIAGTFLPPPPPPPIDGISQTADNSSTSAGSTTSTPTSSTDSQSTGDTVLNDLLQAMQAYASQSAAGFMGRNFV